MFVGIFQNDVISWQSGLDEFSNKVLLHIAGKGPHEGETFIDWRDTTHLDTHMREGDNISVCVVNHEAPADFQEIGTLYQDESRVQHSSPRVDRNSFKKFAQSHGPQRSH